MSEREPFRTKPRKKFTASYKSKAKRRSCKADSLKSNTNGCWPRIEHLQSCNWWQIMFNDFRGVAQTNLGHCGTELRMEIFKLTDHVGAQPDSAPRVIPGREFGMHDVNLEFISFGMNPPPTTSFAPIDVQNTLENSLWRCPQCTEQIFGLAEGRRGPVYHERRGIVLHTEILRDQNGVYSGFETQCLCSLCGAACTRVAPGYVDPHIDAYRTDRSARARDKRHYSGGLTPIG